MKIEQANRGGNRPKKGDSIKVEPIRNKTAIERIKGDLLRRKCYRDHCFFTLGINTAFRANELLSLLVEDVRYLKAGDILEIKQSKNRKHRAVTLNKTAYQAIQHYLEHDLHVRYFDDNRRLFYSQRADVLNVSSVSRMVKYWCRDAGLKGNYGSHTMRKTWGYWQYQSGSARTMPLLMEAYGHSSQKQTLDYLCIQSDDIRNIYTKLEL